MNSLCVIGTSHIAALKAALDAGPPADGWTLAFYGAAGKAFGEMRLDGRELLPVTPRMRRQFALVSGGREGVRIDEHAAFLIAGFAGLDEAMELYATHRSAEMPAAGAQTLVSAECFGETLLDRYLAQPGVRLARQLREAGSAPVLLLARPFITPGGAGRRLAQWRAAVDSGAAGALLEACSSAWSRLAAQGLRVLPQPAESVLDGVYTRPEYGAGSRRLIGGEEHGGPDNQHMNAAFGSLVLRDALAALAGSGT